MQKCAVKISTEVLNESNPTFGNDKARILRALRVIGGDGGNRTRVQKHSTDSSTYLALPFDLTCTTRTRTLRTGEPPIV